MRHRILAIVAILVTATACAGPSAKTADAKPSATVTQEAPTPRPSPTTTAEDPTPSPSIWSEPKPVTPKLTPVTIDDWRYGYAWQGFSTDTNGFGGEYDKPGEVHVTLTVQMSATDDRRPAIPSPNSLWVGENYGFSFFVKPSKNPGCLPLEGVGLCELSSGMFYSGCEELRNDGDGTNFPPQGRLITSCRFDDVFPESVKPSDFKVSVHYEECCETDGEHRVWLPFQALPIPSPDVAEPEDQPTTSPEATPGPRYL
ncbi:hypothetical protein ACFRCW_05005 [Streptomyces sp. NPDC056653]|uniref:hypothetical protein n=1 Tax=Streptomyces sp. NPDC056653 TaxID=3345894 RepID=UPI0036CB86DF